MLRRSGGVPGWENPPCSSEYVFALRMLAERGVSFSRRGFGERLVSEGERVVRAEGARSGAGAGAVVAGLRADILPWLGDAALRAGGVPNRSMYEVRRARGEAV